MCMMHRQYLSLSLAAYVEPPCEKGRSLTCRMLKQMACRGTLECTASAFDTCWLGKITYH